jgi:hypothetical protein
MRVWEKYITWQPPEAVAVQETPQFTADVLWAIANDPANMQLSGQALIVAEIAQRYGLKDRNGKQPPSYRASLGEPRSPHPARVY